jgi:hypothetical protein
MRHKYYFYVNHRIHAIADGTHGKRIDLNPKLYDPKLPEGIYAEFVGWKPSDNVETIVVTMDAHHHDGDPEPVARWQHLRSLVKDAGYKSISLGGPDLTIDANYKHGIIRGVRALRPKLNNDVIKNIGKMLGVGRRRTRRRKRTQ